MAARPGVVLADDALCVVTGASSGIGAEVARRLAGRGCRVVATARRADRLEEVLAGAPNGSVAVAADLTDPATPGRLAEAVAQRGGALALLVNNAGAGPGSGRATPFADAGAGDVEALMELNFLATVRVTAALMGALRAGAPSALVNVSSVSGKVALAGASAYAASKHALAGWSDALYAEERQAGSGVHVGCVYPGFAATEGFPQTDLLARRATRWMVSSPGRVADAILAAAERGRAQTIVPRGYWVPIAVRDALPGLWFAGVGRVRR